MALPRNKKLPRKPVNEPRPPGGQGPRPSHVPHITKPDRDNKKKDDDKGKKRKGPGGRYYGRVGGYRGVDKRAVNRLVNGVLKDEYRDLRRQKQAVRRENRFLTRDANTQYERGLGDLNYVHGETGDFISALTDKNAAMFADQRNTQAQANAALQQQLGTTYGGAADNVTAELARLGIQGGGSTAGLMQDQAFAESLARQSGSNALSSMDMASSNAALGSNLVAGMNQGAMTSNLGTLSNKRSDALSTIRQDRIDQLADINGAMQDAAAGRKDVFFQLLQQLQQTGWSQYMDQQQLKMQRKSQRKSRRRR
jgi:hypothetical protein